MENPTALEAAELRAMCIASALVATQRVRSDHGELHLDELAAITAGLGLDEETDPHLALVIGCLLGVIGCVSSETGAEPMLRQMLAATNERVEAIRMDQS